jgi:hypothetical protein
MDEEAVERMIQRLVAESRRDVHRGDVIAGDLLFAALARILFELGSGPIKPFEPAAVL